MIFTEALFRLFLFWSDIHKSTRDNLSCEVLDFAGLKFYEATGEGKEGIIFTTLDIFSRVELGATLTDDDVASRNSLIAENLNTKTFRNRITAKGG